MYWEPVWSAELLKSRTVRVYVSARAVQISSS